MTAAEVVLSYHNVTKSFGAARALDGVELEIRRGEIFGFIGPDGAGKTTMMRMAMGIINPDEGECLLLGSADRRAARTRAGENPRGLRSAAFQPIHEHERHGEYTAFRLALRQARKGGRGARGVHPLARRPLGLPRQVRGESLGRHEAEARARDRAAEHARDTSARRRRA